MERKRAFGPLVVWILALPFLGCGLFSQLPGLLTGPGGSSIEPGEPAETNQNVRIGQPALVFDLPGLEGGSHSLEEFRGRTLLINFFATWCGPCRAETPAIQELYENYQERGLVVLGVSVDDLDDRQAVSEFVERFGVTYPVALDPLWSTAHRYGVRAIPVSVFIDGDGVVRSILFGSRTAEFLEQEVLKILPPAPQE